ncbi:MAG TPA: DinB family protein, partial [Kribbella sp.]|nr:DinB family protein [Kribbella sp.]
MADFTGADLSGSRFERVDLTNAEFRAADLCHARFRGVDLSGAVMRGVELVDVRIDGEIQNLLINGVDVAPFVTEELDRRHPDRARMRPTDPAGFRDAWDIVERLWDGTVERARSLDPGLLHESVDGEWSFIETLRHLAFATDAWVRRAILGDPSPWDPLDLPWDEMPDIPGIPRDRA